MQGNRDNSSAVLRPALPALLGLCALLALSACGVAERDSVADKTESAADPGYLATDAEIIQTGADGQPRYRLQAARIEQDPRTLEVQLQSIRLETRERGSGGWQVAATQGRLSSDSQRLRLAGDVRLEGGDARDVDRLRLRTSELEYDLQTARARARGEVRITLQGHVLEGKGLDANLRTRQVRLDADVHGQFTR